MPDYLAQLSYNPEAVATLISKPHSRQEVIGPIVEKYGGKLKSIWFSFGKYDIVSILTLPDNVSIVAFSMAVKASGAVKEIMTTPLISIEESIEAMKKASIGCPPCEMLVKK